MIFKKALGLASQPEEVFGAADITSPAMKNAIALWYQLYFGGGSRQGAIFSQRIPYTVVDALQCACFGEYRAALPAQGPAAPGLSAALAALDAVRCAAFQHALIGGEVFLKPVPQNGGLVFSVVTRPGYMVLARSDAGAITAVGCREVCWQNGRQYTLLEKRSIGQNGLLTIESRLYESRTQGSLGRRVPLGRVEKYAPLRESLTLPRPCGLGMVHVKTPMVNCVDHSFDGVSVYAAAADKIVAAARHEARCEDEYRLTRPYVIASVDAVRQGEDGRVQVPEFLAPIVDDEPASCGLTVYNPAPNQAQLEARMQQHLRDIENIVGLRRGMLSGVESAERTATEVAATSARYAMTVAGLCGMWRQAVQQAVSLCSVMGQMYLGWDSAPPPPVQVSFGDGVLYDADKEFERLFRCVEKGFLPRQALVEWMETHR